ncbi:hypothetical protein PPACK8108_LOCUS26435 [Phakopsora pachyrhizi]|uniref:Uncharacterized protein n=1 Tax=Phakopsora pachyrhizi TaxID=170000 RepID=A0AAV0BU65_PHAPC|nr:hypothetical protein PPACK8108_LOCUS26435 [Phakopsora pachyrhizi]
MPDIDEVFKSIEAFEMKTEWLTSSKLGKVLKQVGTLDNSKVPLDEKYNIRARAQALEEKWENKENTQPAQVSAENSTKTETSLPEVEAQDEAAPPEMECICSDSVKTELECRPCFKVKQDCNSAETQEISYPEENSKL